jgi:dipeptidyl aminopeptidase/acylaminoacyl peptidase
MTVADLTAVPRVIEVQLSPDGRQILYTVQRVDWKVDRFVPHLWRRPVDGGAPAQLTDGPGEVLARWSPDGRSICYWSRNQLFLVSADGGEPRALTRHATGVAPDPPVWAPDGSAVYFLAKDAPATPAGSRPPDLVTFEETDFQQQHVWSVRLADGAERKVTAGDWSVVAYRLSRDATHLTLLRAPTPLTIDHYRSDVWIMDLGSGALHEVTRNGVYETEADLSPDNTQVYFVADANEELDVYYGSSLFVVPARGGKPRLVSPDFKYTIDQAAWAPDGKSIFVAANMGVHGEIFRIDVATGAARQLTDGRHALPSQAGGLLFGIVPSAGRLTFLLDQPDRLGDAWTMPLEGGPPKRVTGVYDSLASEFALPRQERVAWKGADGVDVEGLLFYPIGYQPGRRYPLVVQLHGGPPLSDKFGYGPGVVFNYVPLLAAKGYAVLRPNYRGSAGYGSAFIRDIVGHYFNNMHLDVMAGVDALVREGVVDPDRLAVMGWSAGAHLVNKLITFTDRFKAASSGAGVANWISMMAQTDALTRRTFWFGGNPWQKDAPIDLLWSHSPVKDVAKVKTPTLFFVGDSDTRVPQAQAQEMYRGLETNGVPTRLIIGRGAQHDWSAGPLRQQIGKINLELAWFEQHVMGRAFEPEPYPGDAAIVR